LLKKRWKAKVKKLEKSLDKYKSESMQLGEQNDQLKTKHNSYGSQLECKTKEVANLKELNATIEEKLNVREIEVSITLNKFLQNLPFLQLLQVKSF
jgi:hypothetical protein